MPKITPFLWFDGQAEEAAELYVSIFENSRIVETSRFTEAGPGEAGTVMTVVFELDGQQFVGLNGGPQFPFTEAVSFAVQCESQEEIDRFWAALTEGGEEGPCGWLKDRYGLSWHIVPTAAIRMIQDEDRERANRVMQAILGMRKLDLAAIEAAYAG